MKRRIAVIGGGPAGLRAAEVAAANGADVELFDAMPSVGRKFLVAGRGGLNITNTVAAEPFAAHYSGADLPAHMFPDLLREFSPGCLRAWVERFGIPTFVGSGKRVYPEGMKSAPLLRRWVAALRAAGVTFSMRHRWKGFVSIDPLELLFATPRGERRVSFAAVVLALGGASWPQTGSDGSWQALLTNCGITPSPFVPANCRWDVDWSAGLLESAAGMPLKNIVASAGEVSCAGEAVITRSGLEGGPVYTLTPHLRAMSSPVLTLDLKPSLSGDELVRRLAHAKRLHLHEACERWKLQPAARALLEHHPGRPSWTTPAALAGAVKSLPLPLTRPGPIAGAISSAGGIRWCDVDGSLMLCALPGVFAAGEMLDWEAPTGGFLMQGCFSTGTRAGRCAAEWQR